MTTDNDEFRNRVIAAVQAELDRHASVVGAGIEQAREEGRIERARLRAEHAEQLSRLARTVEQVESRSGRRGDRVGRTVDAKIAEYDQKQSARLADLAAGFDRTVSATVAPLIDAVRADHAGLAARVEALEAGLRQLDEQAARLVDHVTDVVARIEQRNHEFAATLSSEVSANVASGLAAVRSELDPRVTGVEQRLAEVHGLVDGVVSSRLVVVDERLAGVDERLAAAQQRIDAEQQRLAEAQQQLAAEQQRIDAERRNLAAEVDERLTRTTGRIDDVDRRLRETAATVADIDLKALDAMKDKLSTAAGEAMLVRIEMERFQKSTNERTDQMAIRLTEVETALQDSSMDVSTAVQLDRLEEIERALAELDPDQFVRKDGRDAPLSATAPDAEPDLLEQPGAETLSLDAAQLITTLDAPARPATTATNGDAQGAIIAATRTEQDD